MCAQKCVKRSDNKCNREREGERRRGVGWGVEGGKGCAGYSCHILPPLCSAEDHLGHSATQSALGFVAGAPGQGAAS